MEDEYKAKYHWYGFAHETAQRTGFASFALSYPRSRKERLDNWYTAAQAGRIS